MLGLLGVGFITFAACGQNQQNQLVALSAADLEASGSSMNENKCRKLMWIHPPKTSSTFCTTISHVCCPSLFDEGVKLLSQEDYKGLVQSQCTLPEPFRRKGYSCVPDLGHFPFPTGEAAMDYIKSKRQTTIIAVTILRNPASRIVSSFLDSAHFEGFSEDEHSRLMKKWSSYPTGVGRMKETILRKAADYIHHPHMIGCYTKMLLGYECLSGFLSRDQPFNQTALDIALQRLRTFFFVGIFEDYEASLQLFHQVANASTVPHWTELTKSRVSSADQGILQYIVQNISSHYIDPYDDQVYDLAQNLFEQSKQKYRTKP